MSIKILIIDDAVHIRRLIARMLTRNDYTILQAGDGVEGLQQLKEQMPDVVTCDISMPVMDGYEFLAAAKSNPDTKHIPIIIITAVGEEEDTVKALDMGADACLTKPFSSSHLIETIQAQLN